MPSWYGVSRTRLRVHAMAAERKLKSSFCSRLGSRLMHELWVCLVLKFSIRKILDYKFVCYCAS